ncbi:MAG: LD-carboxypeptidase [Pyrinomonadaceae bacterium]|nr:LD-carboxypeptidase [Pyrinomonadaceae bacterium]
MLGQRRRSTSRRNNSIIKPKRLSVGDTVGVIAPSSGVSQSDFDDALQNLSELGFKTRAGKYSRGSNGFLSGTDRERLYDLHWAFRNPKLDAVWCVRGGYGASRLLPYVNYNLIRKNPKIFVGYSDITALHIAIFQEARLVTFHGPVGASNFTEYTKKHLLNTLVNPVSNYEINLPLPPEGADPALYKAKVIKSGRCRGRLVGGNLSLLSAMAGTPFGLKNVRGKILFIEDVSEPPYRVDRMLTQLRQSVNMRSLAGIGVGVFTRGEPDPDKPSQSLLEVLKERLGDLGIPVIYGLSFGHIRDQFTLPVGIRAELDTSRSTMTLLEKAVV